MRLLAALAALPFRSALPLTAPAPAPALTALAPTAPALTALALTALAPALTAPAPALALTALAPAALALTALALGAPALTAPAPALALTALALTAPALTAPAARLTGQDPPPSRVRSVRAACRADVGGASGALSAETIDRPTPWPRRSFSACRFASPHARRRACSRRNCSCAGE
ncbi:hypothetical protein ACFFWC_07940 [Plantactinospora siamensis]|uniref:Uncharacterized protein n=1 Tax=Plantactinospora siamensis TaxID=555372 RepID=A0ABV6NXM5_9ACTN